MDERLKYQRNGAITWYTPHIQSTFRKHGPARISNDGEVCFSQLSSSTYNRRSGPSRVSPNGEISYANKHGVWHRTTGPAIIHADGKREYYVRGKQTSADEFFLKYGVL